ncbi:aluminum resistance, partial [mine drainage metagenome]
MNRVSIARRRALEVLDESRRRHFPLAQENARRVLDAFRAARVSEYDFAPSVGYGYGDRSRDTLNDVFAAALGCEAALVRAQIASGTHAIALALWALVRPGGEILVATGQPCDTLQSVLGLRPTKRSFAEWGIGV